MMKKTMLVGMAAFIVAVICAGCATSGTHGEVAENYEKFKEAVAARPPAFVATGEKALDDVGILSAQIYGSTIKYLDEYIKATENNRYYIGFMNDSVELSKEKKIPMGQAMAEVLKEYREADAKVEKDEEKVYPRVIEGFRAIEALKPANKLRELAPIAAQAAEVALNATKVADIVAKTYSSIDFKDVDGMAKKVAVTAALAKVTEQSLFDVRALDFLQDQYKRNIEMEQYMQDDKADAAKPQESPAKQDK